MGAGGYGALQTRVRWMHCKIGSVSCTGEQGQVGACIANQGQVDAMQNRVSLVHWRTRSGGCMHCKPGSVDALEISVSLVHWRTGSESKLFSTSRPRRLSLSLSLLFFFFVFSVCWTKHVLRRSVPLKELTLPRKSSVCLHWFNIKGTQTR